MYFNDATKVGAVTLIDVVVFRGPQEANDLAIWAHELHHVDQYTEWGVRDFAIGYGRDYNAVEAPAYAKGNGFLAWYQNRNGGGFPQPPQAQMGAFCFVINYGRFGPGPDRTGWIAVFCRYTSGTGGAVKLQAYI